MEPTLLRPLHQLSGDRSLAHSPFGPAYSSQPHLSYSSSYEQRVCVFITAVPIINSVKSPCGRASTSQDRRLQDHERLGHISFKRMRQLDIDGITPPTSKRLKPITCPVCIPVKARRANRPAPSPSSIYQRFLFFPPSKDFINIKKILFPAK
jgi:hypothetical protein